jgi:UDP-N-acetylmuramoyl-tripeptide--D-alanyl-D-alanine ligase
MTIEQLYQLYQQHPQVQTDTRQLKKGDIFFALKGENFNGNLFASKALEAGAVAAVIDDAACYIDDRTILVPDVLSTLQQLAKHHRQQFNIPFIAITGSNGKTTSKELVHAVLSTTFKAYTTKGNFNNHIGIPLTLLSIHPDAEMAVIEMGANHQKEIEGYCLYTLPTHGVITNCGKAHLEGFGGEEGVRKGKGELYDFIRAHKGTVFAFWDYDYLRSMSAGIEQVITYGTDAANYQGSLLQADPFIKIKIEKTPEGALSELSSISSQLVGAYNLPNILLAVAVGLHFKVPPLRIKEAIENYTPTNSRSQLLQQGSNQIILDAYNANPSSMKLAIENFATLHAEKKVLMLGSMMELGDASLSEHQAIADLIAQHQWQAVVFVGSPFDKIKHAYLHFANAAEASNWYKAQLFQKTTILIKGSRSMKMETILS